MSYPWVDAPLDLTHLCRDHVDAAIGMCNYGIRNSRRVTDSSSNALLDISQWLSVLFTHSLHTECLVPFSAQECLLSSLLWYFIRQGKCWGRGEMPLSISHQFLERSIPGLCNCHFLLYYRQIVPLAYTNITPSLVIIHYQLAAFSLFFLLPCVCSTYTRKKKCH